MTDFLTDRPVTYRDMQLEQLRQKYAGMAMQAIISNSKYYDECISLADEPNSGFMDSSEVVASEAVHFADRLIEALYPELDSVNSNDSGLAEGGPVNRRKQKKTEEYGKTEECARV